MLNRKAMIIILTVGLIKRYSDIKMSYFPPCSYSKNKIDVELDLSNYATKYDLKNATCVYNDGADKKKLLKKMYIMLRSKILKIKYLILLT